MFTLIEEDMMQDDYCRDSFGTELCHGDLAATDTRHAGIVIDIEKRAGEWWAAVEPPDERAFWHKASDLTVVTSSEL